MEYAEDLDNYWVDGYGYQINYQQACPTLKDMFNFFRYFLVFSTFLAHFSTNFFPYSQFMSFVSAPQI